MKVTVIGGGSYGWAFGFARQFIRSQYIEDVHLVLMDINQEAVELVSRAVGILNRKHDFRIKLEATTELDPALDGADYVLVSISTGGFEAMQHDLNIPEKYGIEHAVGDTVGPGGWLRAVRNVPVFDDFGARMRRLCPEAWMLNVSNPLTVLTRVPHRNHGIKTIGMCPGLEGTARGLARLALAMPASSDERTASDEPEYLQDRHTSATSDLEIDYVATGIDHGSFFIRLHAGGIDILSRLRELGFCDSDEQKDFSGLSEDCAGIAKHHRAGFALWKELGYLPSIGDRHMVENLPWFIVGRDGDLPYGVERTFMPRRIEDAARARQRLEQYVASEDDSALGVLGHGDDPVVTVIESLEGHRSLLWGANYPNVGQIPQLPLGAVVETRCRFDGAGVHPFPAPLPPVPAALIAPQVYRQEAVIDVALTGTFDELVALVLTDPLCCRLDLHQCRAMVQEMVEATRPWIRNPALLDFA